MIGAVTAIDARFALYLLVGLAIGLPLREFAKAWTALRLGDMTPRLYGRLTFRPKPHFDPFGTGILPIFLLVLSAAGASVPVFAYERVGLVTDLSVREGEPAIVGTLNVGSSGEALVLIVLARRVNN